MTAVTALTAQNTETVAAIHEVPPAFVAEQIRVVLSDLGADCIKIGMLHRPEVIEAVATALDAHGTGIPVVLDPVMYAKGGQPLLEPAAIASLCQWILPRARVVTPNLPEAAALAGEDGVPETPTADLATRLLALGPEAVLLKGGHGTGDALVDILAERDGTVGSFQAARITTTSTHGTGCTLASAIATGIAQGFALCDAVVRARAYLFEAIRTAPGFGHGHGPLNHAHTVAPFAGSESIHR